MNESRKDKLQQWAVVLVLAAVAIGGVALFEWWAQPTPNAGSSPEPQAVFTTGSDGFLAAGALDLIPVAVDEAAFDEMNHAAVVKDEPGLRQLVSAGRVFNVRRNASVRVIGHTLAKTQVRILDGPKAGQAGWVPYEWVVSSKK
jgi:hypothetical protein